MSKMHVINDTKAEAIWDTECKHYPRPQFRRRQWQSLNGQWNFCFDDENEFQHPRDFNLFAREKVWPFKIQVPFAPRAFTRGSGTNVILISNTRANA